MINGKLYFENVSSIGNLYLDHCFIEFEEEPILFVCKDKERNLYLCLCSDVRVIQKWIISKIDLKTLTKMVNKEIDLLTALTQNKKVIVVVQNIYNHEHNELVCTCKLNELDLPQKGVLLRCDLFAANKYIQSIHTKHSQVVSENINLQESQTSEFIGNLYEDGNIILTIKESENFTHYLPVEYMENNCNNMSNVGEIITEEYNSLVHKVYNEKKTNMNYDDIYFTAA